MLQGFYGAAVSMKGAERQHEVIAKNLAHAQMPGFRRAQIVQGTFQNNVEESNAELSKRSSTGIRGIDLSHDFTQGAVETTDRPFDVSIQGTGFFVLEGQNGPLYTRNGAFTINDQGQVTSHEGRLVLGTNGPIQMDPTNGLAGVTIDETGRVTQGVTEVGQLKVLNFPEPKNLVNVGTTLFQDPESTAQPATDMRITQGQLEQSNVHPVQELVDMIAVQRRYDAAANTLRMLMRTLEQRINLQAGR